MTVHDWPRAHPSTIHSFHLPWNTHLAAALNAGLLPPDHDALVEAHAGHTPVLAPSPKGKRRTLTIRHTTGHRIIALIEILSPSNKSSANDVADFVRKIVDALRTGIHVVFIDLLPPGRHDPDGMNGAVMEALAAGPYDLPEDKPLTFASYAASSPPTAYLEHLAVGDALPAMPLFLSVQRYIELPLGPTYEAAYRGMPAFWREVIEGQRALNGE